MPKIERPLQYLRFYHNGSEFLGLVDGGSQLSLLIKELLPWINGASIKGEEAPKLLVGVGGAGLGIQQWVEVKVTLEKKIEHSITFGIPNCLPCEIILGLPFLESLSAVHDYSQAVLYLPEGTIPLLRNQKAGLVQVNVVAIEDEKKSENKNQNVACTNEVAVEQEETPEDMLTSEVALERLEILIETLYRYSHLWKGKRIGRVKGITHKIKLMSDKPIVLKLRPNSEEDKETIREQLLKMLKDGIIRPSHSEYAMTVVLANKKDGSKRFCIDFRPLNKITVPDRYPLPRISELIQAVKGTNCWIALDLRAGYWQIPMDPESIKYTAFRCFMGHFEFTVMPFGLTNAPATFQRMMDQVFGDLRLTGVLVYLDDILIRTVTVEPAIILLETVLARMSEYDLTLNLKKCVFFPKRLQYLGQLIEGGQLIPDLTKVELLSKLPTPRTVTDVRSLTGALTQWQTYIRAFADIMAPIFKLLQKHKNLKRLNRKAFIQWTEQHQQAKQTALETLKNSVLTLPASIDELMIETLATAVAICAILNVKESEQWRPMQYYSLVLKGAQLRWPPLHREFYALIATLKKFDYLLRGRTVIVHTSCGSLDWLLKNKEGKFGRWASTLAEYDLRIVKRTAKQLQHVEFLAQCIESDNVEEAEVYLVIIFTWPSWAEIKLYTLQTLKHCTDLVCFKKSNSVSKVSPQLSLEPVRRWQCQMVENKAINSRIISVTDIETNDTMWCRNLSEIRSIIPFHICLDIPFELYCDGACSRNGYPDAQGGYGIHVPVPIGWLQDECGPLPGKPTNQKAELYAINRALENIIISLKDNKCKDKLDRKIIIYTDSEYAVRSCTEWIHYWRRNGFITSKGTPVVNKKLIKKVADKLKKLNGTVELRWVRRENMQLADSLAKQGRQMEVETDSTNASVVECYFTSRVPIPTVEDIINAQKEEDFPQTWGHYPKNGVLYSHKWIWVPPSKRPEVLAAAHSAPPFLHAGIRRTKKIIRKMFNWSYLDADVRDYIKACPSCSRNRSGYEKYQGLMKIHPVRCILDTVYMDLWECRYNEQSYKSLTMIDPFSKWGVVVPLTEPNAKEISDAFLDHWVLKYGPPARLVTDREKVFTGEVMSEVARHLGVTRITSAPYHPEGNAVIEAFHKNIAEKLRYIRQQTTSFQRAINLILFAYHATIHSSTGNSPFYLCYGLDPRLPPDHDWRTEPVLEHQERLKFLSLLRLEVQFQAKEIADKRVEQRNKYRYPYEFEVGQLVLCRVVTEARLRYKTAYYKAVPRWALPFRVVKVLPSKHSAIAQCLITGMKREVHIEEVRFILPPQSVAQVQEWLDLVVSTPKDKKKKTMYDEKEAKGVIQAIFDPAKELPEPRTTEGNRKRRHTET